MDCGFRIEGSRQPSALRRVAEVFRLGVSIRPGHDGEQSAQPRAQKQSFPQVHRTWATRSWIALAPLPRRTQGWWRLQDQAPGEGHAVVLVALHRRAKWSCRLCRTHGRVRCAEHPVQYFAPERPAVRTIGLQGQSIEAPALRQGRRNRAVAAEPTDGGVCLVLVGTGEFRSCRRVKTCADEHWRGPD